MPTTLLNDDGTASMATMIMSSHHAFRRDVACFASALGSATPGEHLAEEWTRFRGALHGHHTVEDTAMFPDLRVQHPELGTAIDQLDGHHRAIDPLLEAGDRLFGELGSQHTAALELITTLARLLDEHLEAEEHAIIPMLRTAKTFPLPPTEEVVAMYAEGFAWSTAGIAPTVQDQLFAMLPAALVAKIPAARAAFDDRCRRVWGHVHADASQTSVPSR
jgi:hypothetical protein